MDVPAICDILKKVLYCISLQRGSDVRNMFYWKMVY